MAFHRISYLENSIIISCTRLYQGTGLTGLTINLTVKRESDNKYWSGSEWSDTETILTMVESDIPGEYEYHGITLDNIDELVCHAYIEEGIAKFDSIERITIIKKPLALNDNVDTQTVNYILECIMSMVNGKLSISGDTVTLYKRDNTTPLSVIQKFGNDRIRLS